jgi:uncharacterized protein YlxW (UPF0749 family)
MLLFLALLASGCPSPRLSPSATAPAEQLFLDVVADLANDRAPAAMVELERLYPQSQATASARTLVDAFAKLQQQVTQLQKEKSRCQQEKDRLSKDLRQLQEDQEKLRKLVVDMEKRRR